MERLAPDRTATLAAQTLDQHAAAFAAAPAALAPSPAAGNLARAAGGPIYLVHGAEDFLFPVALAHVTRDVLTAAGAALMYRELPDLSHTYPRSENVRILAWFEGVLRS